jgi:Bacterial EndoU nuclease
MAVDRRSGRNLDEAGDGAPREHESRGRRPDRPAARAELADNPPARSGWDSVHGPGRPPLDALHINAERAAHILDGDVTGGGHRHGTGIPGKTEFPADWDEATVMDSIAAVAHVPDSVEHQPNGRWFTCGECDNVWVTVIINPDGAIWTAWPEEGSPGVVRNPKVGAP